jgi:hypothetical protein
MQRKTAFRCILMTIILTDKARSKSRAFLILFLNLDKKRVSLAKNPWAPVGTCGKRLQGWCKDWWQLDASKNLANFVYLVFVMPGSGIAASLSALVALSVA